MKLLTWMHRKLRQNNTNEMLPPGQAMFNTRQHLHSKQPSSSGAAAFNFAQPPPKESSRKPASFTCCSSSSMEFVELDSREFPEQPFHYGFLAIGTLGTQTTTLFMSSSEPETPTFSISVDNIADRESQYVTQGELKLINVELLDKKVLGPETKEEDSSARNSSTSTTAAPAMESSGINNNNINNVCPLQGYLLGSTVDQLPAERLMPEKKESCRTSLGELFQRQKAADEGGGGGGGWGSSSTSEPAAAAGEKRSAINHLIRKILKRNNNNNNSAASAETKLHKKKVHPETSTCMPRTTLNTQSQSGCSRIKHGHPNCISYNGDIGSKELWIKSDADYLVLEL